MDKKEFEFLLSEKEGLKLEFKENFDSKNICKEMVAFANTNGGLIFLGVNDKGEIKGTQLTNKLKSEIHDVARNCDPPIEVEIEAYANVTIIKIEEGLSKPYRCSTGFFIRQGSNSQKLSTEEIREFFNREGKILFDELINNDFDFQNDFNRQKFYNFLQKARISRIIPDEDILRNLGLLSEAGKFRNAAVLFFCDNVERFLRQAVVTCVSYKGTDKYKIIDRKDFTEDVMSNFNNAMAFLIRNLRLEYKIETAGPRIEVLEIPEEALREAVVNAMTHRDYNQKGANIQIDIYDDRVEISNPGGLVSAIKKEDFGKKSVTRNPLLFSLFKNAELVEKIGSGITRIRNAMKDASLPPPIFELSDFFTVILRRPSTPQVTPQVTPQAKRTLEFTELENKIISLISSNPKISRRYMARKLGISPDTTKEYLERLKDKKAIKRIGKTSAGHWEVLI